MIAFDLKCRPHEHRFEGWFAAFSDFEAQLAQGYIACPTCGSADVVKALSVPNVGVKSNRAVVETSANQQSTAPTQNTATPPDYAAMSVSSIIPPAMRDVIAKVAAAQAEALSNSEWVGDGFVEEVRAQHYGETDIRPVHGEASAKAAAELAEEGIAVMPILFPIVPPNHRN